MTEGEHRKRVQRHEPQTQNGNTLTESATARVVATDGDSHTMAVDCRVVAEQPAAATGVRQCYLLGADGRRFNGPNPGGFPGNVAVAGGVVDVPRQSYRVCVQGVALFMQSGTFMEATTACSA